MDIFQYSGPMSRGDDLDFIEFVANEKKHPELLLILTTDGGNPDAAYKIGRYLQHRYDKISIMIPGLCKSAGTLLAIAANELVFCPYGELGPLDIQLTKTDNLTGQESGLNIGEALFAMEARACEVFHVTVKQIIHNSSGVLSYPTAAKAASDVVSSIYGPVFSRFDPEEVGSRTRSMRIGEDYGRRLNQKFTNLKSNALEFLSQSYPSHGFVIDFSEAAMLFERTREATKLEKLLVEAAKNSRFSAMEHLFQNHTALYATLNEKELTNGKTDSTTQKARAQKASDPERDGESSATTGRAKCSETVTNTTEAVS